MILVFDTVSHRLFIEEDDYQPQSYEVIRSKRKFGLYLQVDVP